MDCRHFGETTKYNLALVDILNPVNSGYINPDEGLLLVERPPNGPRYEIIEIHQFGIVAQLVPLNPESGAHIQIVRRDSRKWVINSRIDLNSFGWIY